MSSCTKPYSKATAEGSPQPNRTSEMVAGCCGLADLVAMRKKCMHFGPKCLVDLRSYAKWLAWLTERQNRV